MDLKQKELYPPGYNLLFNVIAIPSKAFFISIDEFVDACGMPHWVLLFDGLPLWGSLLILICPALNFCTPQFTVDFVVTFYVPYTKHILAWISLPKTFSSVNNWITFHCSFVGAPVDVTAIAIFLVTPKFSTDCFTKICMCTRNTFSNTCMQFQHHSVIMCGEGLSDGKILNYPS